MCTNRFGGRFFFGGGTIYIYISIFIYLFIHIRHLRFVAALVYRQTAALLPLAADAAGARCSAAEAGDIGA